MKTNKKNLNQQPDVVKGKMKAYMGDKKKAKMKAHMGHGRLLENRWLLIKKDNGECECVKRAKKRVVVGRFTSQEDCEDHRAHNC